MSPLFRNRAREEAESAIRSCDETLAILESGSADLGPAERLRAQAGDLRERGAYRDAVEACRRAEETARLLDRLHTAATEGVSRLRSERTRMVRLGITVDDIDGLIGSAGAWMSKTVARDGDPRFPAYAKAGELALKGLRLTQERVPRFKAASAAVFEAEQALRQMVEANRFVDRAAFEFLVLKPAADVLGEARAKLRANAFPEAQELARWTLATAKQIDATCLRVTQAYENVSEGAKALRSEGGVAPEVDDLLAVCRTALGNGKFDDAAEILERAGARLATVRDVYRSLVLRLRNAEDTINEVEGWGFEAGEPRAILAIARGQIEAGEYLEAGARLDEARRAAVGLRETHRATAGRIAEARRSVAAMRAKDPATAGEAEGLLVKAESLLEEGRYRACDENLQIAALLLADIEGAGRGSPAPGFAAMQRAARAIEPTCLTCDGPLADDGTCPTCSAVPEPENVDPVRPITQAVAGARKVLAEIGRDNGAAAERPAPTGQGCAMCGGPLGDADVLCAKCQGILKAPR